MIDDNDVVTSKGPVTTTTLTAEVAVAVASQVTKPSDNTAYVALHKERYLHWINEKYLCVSAKKNTTAMTKAAVERIVGILVNNLACTAKET